MITTGQPRPSSTLAVPMPRFTMEIDDETIRNNAEAMVFATFLGTSFSTVDLDSSREHFAHSALFAE